MENSENIGRYISCLYRQEQSYISKKLAPYNIGSGQYIFLLALFKQDGVSQEFLSHGLLIDKATTLRAIKKLMEEEYVYRVRDNQDKRSYKIFLTEKARAIEPTVLEILKQWNGFLLQDLTIDEKNTIIGSLEKMAKSIGPKNSGSRE